eukprot:155331-Rhodomonas_salina.1
MGVGMEVEGVCTLWVLGWKGRLTVQCAMAVSVRQIKEECKATIRCFPWDLNARCAAQLCFGVPNLLFFVSPTWHACWPRIIFLSNMVACLALVCAQTQHKRALTAVVERGAARMLSRGRNASTVARTPRTLPSSRERSKALARCG